MAYYTPPPKYQTELVARRGYDGVGGVLETIGSKIESAATGTLRITGTALDVIGGRTQQPTVVQQESSMPSWLLPVGIAAAVGVIFLVSRRK